jgi:hypothetical protein
MLQEVLEDDDFLQVSSARRLVNMSGKIIFLNKYSDYYPKMVSHVQIRQLVYELSCSKVKITLLRELSQQKYEVFQTHFWRLCMVRSESVIHPCDRDGIYYPKMVSHVQSRQLVYELSCSKVKKKTRETAFNFV